MEKIKKYLPPLLFVAGVLAGCFLSRHLCSSSGRYGHVNVKVDTLYVRDTMRVETPVIHEVRTVDTMYLSVTEFEVVHDTAFVQLPREEVEYRDSSYRAVVSGFRPRLEELDIYQKERIITIETTRTVKKEPSRWALSVSGGYGVSAKGLTPYIGVGISYNLYTFNSKKPPN